MDITTGSYIFDSPLVEVQVRTASCWSFSQYSSFDNVCDILSGIYHDTVVAKFVIKKTCGRGLGLLCLNISHTILNL